MNESFKNNPKIYFSIHLLISLCATGIALYIYEMSNKGRNMLFQSFKIFFLNVVDCPKGWTSFDKFHLSISIYASKCYKAVITNSTTYTREEARIECEKEGSKLASIHSQEENDIAASLLGRNGWLNGLWVGQWIWDDGSDWDFTNSLTNETLNGQDCLQMATNSEWVSTDCEDTCQAFLCKMSPKNERREALGM